ncbi:MAG: ABATE domain-containing protein, partial [Microbacterium sp.]
MVFIHDTKRTLMMVVDLVNTLPGFDDADALQTTDDLRRFLETNPYTGSIRHDAEELESVRELRSRLRELWAVDRIGAVPIVNDMLADGRALPRLVIHDEYDWHIHATSDDSPLATRMMV